MQNFQPNNTNHRQDEALPRLYKGKYRIDSVRLKDWDYSTEGYYFVTICIKNREYYFGDIVDEKMILSEMGKIAEKFWLEIPQHFDNIILNEYVVMPNHVHGILEIRRRRDEALPRLYTGDHPEMSKISPKAGSLPVVIGSYKSIVTKTINQQFPNLSFKWQSRFYDHVVRDLESLGKIQQYINTNPNKWEQDKNNQEGLLL